MAKLIRQGHEQVFTPALDQLQQATSQLEQAQAARIMKGALYQVVKDGDPELISGLAGNGMLSGASAGVSGSLTLLQSLRGEEAQTQAKLNELSAKFGPGYPKLAELQSNLDSTQKSIRAEDRPHRRSCPERLHGSAADRRQRSRSLSRREKPSGSARTTKLCSTRLRGRKRPRAGLSMRTLVSRMKEADVVAGMRSSNITLVDPARAPANPAKPSAIKYAAASIAGGLLFGICGALFRDATDTRIQELGEMETAVCRSFDRLASLP